MMIVSPHQSLITQPGLIPNRDGPGISNFQFCKGNFKSAKQTALY
jgi:hypothetical protein